MLTTTRTLPRLSGVTRLRGQRAFNPLKTSEAPSKNIHSSAVRQQNYYGSDSSGSAAGTFIKIVGVSGLAIGVPVGYALYDPKFRATLESYLPFMKSVFERIAPSSSPATNNKPKSAPSSPSLPFYVPPKPQNEHTGKKILEVEKETPAQKDAEDIDSRPDEVVAKTGAVPTGAVANSSVSGLPLTNIVVPSKEPVKPPAKVIADRKQDKQFLDAKKEIIDLKNVTQTLTERNQKLVDSSSQSKFESFLDLLDGRKLTSEEEKLVEAAVNSTIERLEQEFEDYVLELEQEHEWDLQLQLKRQIAAHADTVVDALKRQESELEKHFQARLDRRVEEERKRYNLQVAGALGQILGIQQSLLDRSKSERAGQKAQYLWHVSHAIYDCVKYRAVGGAILEERTAPLGKYITLAKLFSDSHPFVLSILRAVPEEALSRGVQTEDFLRQRFNQVHKVARRVALIQDDNQGLFRYFLSYLQTVFISDQHYDLSKLPEVSAADLDTFRILSTAAKCVQRGDLENAVRFVGQLKGEPRKVAQDWLKEARLYLETKQIARLLLAHATSVGLSTVPVDVKKKDY